MEASEQDAPMAAQQDVPRPGSDTQVGERREQGGPSAFPGVAQGDREEGVENRAVETARDEVPEDEELRPAAEQAPVATEAEEAIIGDPGFREQQPRINEGGPQSANQPHASSAPPPSRQSGVPLAEDREAGVEPGPKGPVNPVREDEGEVPANDASEGQTATSPGGGA